MKCLEYESRFAVLEFQFSQRQVPPTVALNGQHRSETEAPEQNSLGLSRSRTSITVK
jgi:hypothetical protein